MKAGKNLYIYVAISVLIMLFFALMVILQRPKANLTQAEVIQIAEGKARSEGYDVSKYNMTGCRYEFVHKDRTWSVFFELKPPTPPGAHFLVLIDDQTKEVKLARGK